MALLEIDDKVYKIPNKVMEAFEDMSDYIKELEAENKILKELNVCVGCNNNPDYKKRCELAIKYLKLKVDIPKNHLEEAIRDMEEDLLKILGGEKDD